MNQNPATVSNAASSLKEKRSMAKTGMIVSMGALVVTGFMRNRESSALHVGSGLALIGFSYWHYKLYEPKTGSPRQ